MERNLIRFFLGLDADITIVRCLIHLSQFFDPAAFNQNIFVCVPLLIGRSAVAEPEPFVFSNRIFEVGLILIDNIELLFREDGYG